MVKLFCAIVGVSGSSFHVDIDENETVSNLKDAIKDKNSATITCDARKLQLFLAKTTDGVWRLTENDVMKGVKDTDGLTPLEFVRRKLRRVGLSDEQVSDVDEDDEAAGNGPVHVLVVVPGHVRVNIGGTSSRALKYMQQDTNGGPSTVNASYLPYWWSLQSLFWPTERIQPTKKDV